MPKMSKGRLKSNPLKKSGLSWIGLESATEHPETSDKERNKDSRRAGLREGWIRTSLVVKEDILGKIKALAWWERKTPRKIINEALTQYLKDKEIKPIPVEDGQEQEE